MDKVEKVARAIYEARGAHEPPRAWRKWEDIGDEARAVWCQCATAALSAAHAEPVDVRAGGINSAVPVAIRPSPFREDLDMVAVAAEAEKQPVAWRVHDWADGWILFDNEARARHEADNSTGVIEPLFATAIRARGEAPNAGANYRDTSTGDEYELGPDLQWRKVGDNNDNS